MTAQTLRDYQQRGRDNILGAYQSGAKKVLAVSPTGSGKTTLFCHLIAELARKGRRSLIIVHRRELAQQAANRLSEFGIDFGFIMAGEPEKPYALVQIASVQTLIRRHVPKASLVVCDEAHLSTAKSWSTVLQHYDESRILGCTATPWRLAGKPLVGAYDACVVVATPGELRQQGHLCDYVGFSYLAPDLSKVKTTGGDYNEQQSAKAMRAPAIVDNIVEQWLKHASTLSTVVFAVTVEHSLELTAKFKAAGVSAEHIDGETPTEQRRAVLRRVESGATQVLCNVGIAVEGLDIPRLKCCVLARPTKSLARAIQMMGRVRRPWNGVTARIHDHAFNIKIHGLPDSERNYDLHAKEEKPPALTTCSECLAVFTGRTCPSCAHENEPQVRGERELATIDDAEIFEFSSDGEPVLPAKPPVQITWNNPGRVVEGIFTAVGEEETKWGKRKRYAVKGKRDYSLPGTTELDQLMRRVKLNDKIRVTQLDDEALSGGRTKKRFRLEVDDEIQPRANLNIPDVKKQHAAAMWAEIEAHYRSDAVRSAVAMRFESGQMREGDRERVLALRAEREERLAPIALKAAEEQAAAAAAVQRKQEAQEAERQAALKETIQRMYWDEEKSTEEIGIEIGKSSGRVWLLMKRLGIPLRDHGQATALGMSRKGHILVSGDDSDSRKVSQ